MITTSAIYNSLWANPAHEVETKVVIDGTTYNMDAISTDSIPRVYGSLYSTPSAGGVASRQFDLSIKLTATPARCGQVSFFVRLKAGATTSEWIPKGVFFIDTRKYDEETGFTTLHGFDAMLRMEQPYFQGGSVGTWPRASSVLIAEICQRIGVTLDPRTVLNDNFLVEMPSTDLKMREVASYVAAYHGGNWVITDEGKLNLVPLMQTVPVSDIDLDMEKLEQAPAFDAWSGVNYYYEEMDEVSAGDSTGRVLEIHAPNAKQAMADAALLAIEDTIYRPFSARSALLNPAVELGDCITVNNIDSIAASITTNFSALCEADVAAPEDEEIDHEYEYVAPVSPAVRREIARTSAAIRIDMDSIEAEVSSIDGRTTLLEQTIDGFSFSVSEPHWDGSQGTVTLTISMGGNTWSGVVAIDGNVNISGQLSADELYANMGDIADLYVKALSTSRRIPLYLAGDTSNDNYIKIEGKKLQFMAAVTDGTAVQAQNPNGENLYWEQDISNATIGTNGYPYINGQRVFTTTQTTNWPVMIYSYVDYPRREIYFDDSVGNLPVDTFGVGYGNPLYPDRGKGFLQKATDYFGLWLVNNVDEALGIFMSNDYTDITGLRKTKAMDFSQFDGGYFTETIDGDIQLEYRVTFDSNNQPVSITDDDGHICTIAW